MQPEVLHVRSSAGLYGAEYVILSLIPALTRTGIESRLLCLDNPYHEEQLLYDRAQGMGVLAQRVPCRRRFDFATIAGLRQATRNLRGNTIVHVHDYKSALHALLACRSHCPIVATSHGHFATEMKLRAYQRLENWLMRHVDAVCIVSAEMREPLLRVGVKPDRIHLIENGINTERFAPEIPAWPRADFDIPDDAILFGSAMRLNEQKNPVGLVEAFANTVRALPQAMLIIAGDGPLREAVLLRAAQLGVTNRVRIIGARNDLEHFYTMLDVFVLPSWYEGLPLALLEAMAASRPCVVTAVGQVPTVVGGLAVEKVAAGDLYALAQAMTRAGIDRVASGLRERVMQRYSVDAMARAYAQIYSDTVNHHERAAA